MGITIKEIAKRADVGISTVSYVLNNKSGAIKASEATRQKILSIAKELNYTPSIMAKGLREGKTYLAGVILGNITSSFIPEILQGIEDVFHKNNYNMILCSYKSAEDCAARIEQLKRRKIDGLISFSGIGLDYAVQRGFMKNKTAMVSLCQKSDIEGIASVYSDEEKIGDLAAEYISNAGHRDILIVDGKRPMCVAAFRKKLAEKGIVFNDNMLVNGYSSFDDGREVIRLIKKKKLRITAAFVYSDVLVAGMIYEAQKQGIKIPQDLSILGIDNMPICTMVNPTITTVAQQQYEQGSKAAELLLLMIGKENKIEDCVLEPFILERESFCSVKRI